MAATIVGEIVARYTTPDGAEHVVVETRRADAGRDRPRPLAVLAHRTSQPASRLRRWIREGRMPAVRGARGAWHATEADVWAIVEAMPAVPMAGDGDEIARLVGGGRG